MNVKQLINHLQMFPDDMPVYIQTVKDDFASPLEREKMKIWPAIYDQKYNSLEPAKLVLTAMIKD